MPATSTSLPAIASLLLGVGLLTVANALLGSLVSVRMAIEGFPRPLSGLVMSGYFVGFVLGSWYGPRVITRVGHIRAFAAFAAILGVASTTQALLVAPLPWLLLRGAVGFAIAGKLMVAESWLSASASGTHRGRVFSFYMIAIYLTFGAGQFALALGDPAGLTLFVAVALILSASILPIVLTSAHAPPLSERPRLQLRRVYSIAPLAVAGAFVAGLAVGAVQSLGPQFGADLGMPVARISQFMGVFFLSGLLLQWPVGLLSDRMDRRRVLAAIALLTALTCWGIAFVEFESFTALLLLAVLGGGTLATLYPLSVAHANDRLRDENVIAITAALLLTNGLGAIAGPLLAAGAMMALGPSGLFHTAAAPCALLGLYATYRMATHRPVDQDRFATVAQTTPVVLELDPRADPEAPAEPSPAVAG